MNSVIFNDWHGRLSILAGRALQQDDEAILGCHRLLGGRENIPALASCLSSEHREQVLRAWGPPSRIPSLLSAERRSVISPRNSDGYHGNCSSALEGNIETVSPGTSVSSALRAEVYALLIRACVADETSPLEFGNSVRANANSGMLLMSLQSGDLLETLTYRPNDIDFTTL